jgi:flagellar protein FliO/FliZ
MMIRIRHFITMTLCFISTVALALPAESPNIITHQELMRVVTGLLCILLLIVCLAWIVKRLNVVKFSSSKGFQSIATMSLGPKEKIVLLKVGVRYLLIGIGASTVNILHDFGEEQPQGFDSENKPTFAELLKSAVGKK